MGTEWLVLWAREESGLVSAVVMKGRTDFSVTSLTALSAVALLRIHQHIRITKLCAHLATEGKRGGETNELS